MLASADLHGDHTIYRWLVQVARQLSPDVLVLAGDLLGCPNAYDTVEEAQQADAAEILAILEGVSQPVLYLMGNDDMIELEPTNSTIRSIHGDRVELGDVNFVGYQYSLPFMAGVYEKLDEEIRKDLAAIGSLVDKHTVLVTHSPAYGVLDVGVLDEHAGSRAIKGLIEERNPLLHIHGHIHQELGHQGLHFNVAAAGHRRAVLINTDTMGHEVIGHESV
jgi:Icc-related predicted phosphoesterase